MNERASCTKCIHRRGISSMTPGYTVCHYLVDSGEVRGCPPDQCTHWRMEQQTAEQWITLLERIKEVDILGK